MECPLLAESRLYHPAKLCLPTISDTSVSLDGGHNMEVELVTSLKRHATKTLSELHAPKQPILIA